MNICTPPPAPLDDPTLPRAELGSRALFPDLRFDAYLAHAAISPAHLPQTRAVERALLDLSAFGAAAFLAYDAQRARLRRALAALLGAEPGELALSPGTTHSITDLALSLPLRSSDRIVLIRGEFPANVVPWVSAAKAAGATVSFLPAPDPLDPDAGARLVSEVEGELERGARYVAASAVEFQTGFRLPTGRLGRLCREHRAHLLVDAIQCVGPVPLSVVEEGISALVGGAHKWLLGSEGAGYLYLSQELQAELTPKTPGWLSLEGGDRFLFEGAGLLDYDLPKKQAPAAFEGSTASLLGFVAMEAGVELVRALGPQQIFDHVQAYHDAIEPALVELGLESLRAPAEGRSAILSFRQPRGIVLADLAGALRQRGVMISIPDGHIRLAPHFANALTEVPLVRDAFQEALRAGSRGSR